MKKRAPAACAAAYINSLPGDSVYRVTGLPEGAAPEDLLFRRGEAAAEAGDLPTALAAFRLYLRRASPGGHNLFQIFNAACLTGDFDRAFSALDRVNALGLPTGQLIEIANPWYCVYDQAHLRRLAARLEEGLASRPAPYGEAYLLTLKSAAGLNPGGELKKLLRGFRRLRGGPGRDAWLYFKAGETALNMGACGEAAELLSGVLRAEPANLQARGRLAEALLCQGRTREGLAAFGGTEPSIGVWHGEALLWLGSYAAALKKFEAQGARAHHLAWCWRGAALFKLGRLRAALKNLDQAVALRPGDTEALVWRAEALEAAGRRAGALADLRAAARINPGHLWAQVGLTLHYLGEDDLPKALEHFKLPPALTARLAARAGLRRAAHYPPSAMKKMLLLARRLARGCRRHEPYLLALWLP